MTYNFLDETVVDVATADKEDGASNESRCIAKSRARHARQHCPRVGRKAVARKQVGHVRAAARGAHALKRADAATGRVRVLVVADNHNVGARHEHVRVLEPRRVHCGSCGRDKQRGGEEARK